MARASSPWLAVLRQRRLQADISKSTASIYRVALLGSMAPQHPATVPLASAMIYFTKELWAGWQDDGIAGAQDDWNNRLRKYWAQFKLLESRLGKKTAKFLRTARLHDSTFVNLALNQERALKRQRELHSIEAQIELRSAGKPVEQYVLKYSAVRLFKLDYPSDRPLFFSSGLGDWGYDEITAASRQFLRHEVLFASGATLMIEFQKLVCRRTKLQSVRTH